MSADLPEFRPISAEQAHAYIARALSHKEDADETFLIDFVAYPDHHFRAIFRLAYFTLAEGSHTPSKSQWNTLKKRLKRIRSDVFIFKTHGYADCATGAEAAADPSIYCAYVDFAFFKES